MTQEDKKLSHLATKFITFIVILVVGVIFGFIIANYMLQPKTIIESSQISANNTLSANDGFYIITTWSNNFDLQEKPTIETIYSKECFTHTENIGKYPSFISKHTLIQTWIEYKSTGKCTGDQNIYSIIKTSRTLAKSQQVVHLK